MQKEELPRSAFLAGKRLLVVDDNRASMVLMTDLLAAHGMEVRFVDSGSKALSYLHDGVVDIVIMDIMMPDMDGFETIRRIRDDDRHASLPIIAVTAMSMHGDREKCLAAGASDYVAKPIDVDHLVLQVHSALEKADEMKNNRRISDKFALGEARMARLEMSLQYTNASIDDLKTSISEVLDAVTAIKGGKTVLGWAGKAFVWLGGIAMAYTAIRALFHGDLPWK